MATDRVRGALVISEPGPQQRRRHSPGAAAAAAPARSAQARSYANGRAPGIGRVALVAEHRRLDVVVRVGERPAAPTARTTASPAAPRR